MAEEPSERPIAFINLPYAKRYEKVYLAFIAGVAGYGLVPTAAVRDPSSHYQLERIYQLISAAQYSFHDLSCMSLDGKAPRTPRLNMAFELGLAVAFAKGSKPEHQWFVFDTVPHRLEKALSDLGGIRTRIHDRSPESVLRCLMNALAREKNQPTLKDLLKIYGDVERMARKIKAEYSDDLFDTRPFNELAYVASTSAHLHIASLSTSSAAAAQVERKPDRLKQERLERAAAAKRKRPTPPEQQPDVTLEFSNTGPFILRNSGGTACEVRIDCDSLNEGQIYQVSFSIVPDLHDEPIVLAPDIAPPVLLNAKKDIMSVLRSVARGRAMLQQDPRGVKTNSAITDRLVTEMEQLHFQIGVSYTDRRKSKRWLKSETLIYDPRKETAYIEHGGVSVMAHG